jgi:flagellar basal body-associated protein FliL
MLQIEGSTNKRPTRSQSLIKGLIIISISVVAIIGLLVGGMAAYSWYMGQKEGVGRACRYDNSANKGGHSQQACYNI